MNASGRPTAKSIDYEALGLEPPEHMPHMTDIEQESIFRELRKQPHIWQQQPALSGGGGWDIFCENGHARHGFYTIEFILQGTNVDGTPKLHKIVAQPNAA